jgi:hypothetical protein
MSMRPFERWSIVAIRLASWTGLWNGRLMRLTPEPDALGEREANVSVGEVLEDGLVLPVELALGVARDTASSG